MRLLYYLLSLYETVIVARILLSWIRIDPYHPVAVWLRKLTDPVLEPARRLLPVNAMGMDFSPMIVLVVLHLIKQVVLRASFSGSY